MENKTFPITPPPELVKKWMAEIWHEGTPVRVAASDLHIATQAARWGSDQELEACLNEIYKGVGLRLIPYGSHRELLCSDLRAARRPKTPSLKEQALAALAAADGADHPVVATVITADQHALIRRALEQLDD